MSYLATGILENGQTVYLGEHDAHFVDAALKSATDFYYANGTLGGLALTSVTLEICGDCDGEEDFFDAVNSYEDEDNAY